MAIGISAGGLTAHRLTTLFEGAGYEVRLDEQMERRSVDWSAVGQAVEVVLDSINDLAPIAALLGQYLNGKDAPPFEEIPILGPSGQVLRVVRKQGTRGADPTPQAD